MRFFRSFRRSVLQNRRWVKFQYGQPVSYYYRKWPPLVAGYIVWLAGFMVAIVAGHSTSGIRQPQAGNSKSGFGIKLPLPGGKSLRLQGPLVLLGQPPFNEAEGQSNSAIVHANIVTTVFWVGEPGDKDNSYIANIASAWDGDWQTHFGGSDNPDNRNGYLPAAFTPKENPFYFALPYSDITNSGTRRASASNCPLYATMNHRPYSWCKNSWIAIRHGVKVVYAQWQDVGPFEENDTAYVFGNAAPKNKQGSNAGLDVSPAVRDYLRLQDVDRCDWVFVAAKNVPAGPWKQTVTTSLGDSI